ncbi:MAG: iron-sulfur cluster assembly protein, partial [Magnetococcales bacterium]|nr:iron-sulfur cluster assembly protein [Magnetococcales bacterium]
MSDVQPQQVLDALKTIIDPDLKKDIVSLGFVKDVVIEGGKVSFKVELTTPA